MGLDKRLEDRFRSLEKENRVLHREVSSLKNSQTNQTNQGGNSVRRSINSMLRISTISKITNKHLYIPQGKNIHPVGPRFRRRRLL